MKIYKTDKEKQETNIVVDYYSRMVIFYTSKKVVIQRLIKQLPETNEIYYTKNEVSGVTWRIAFKDKKALRKLFSKTLIIGT